MARLQQCMDKEDKDPLSDPWPTTKVLFEELTLRFQVISERDYARHKIENFKQGTMRVDDFMVEFEALVAKSGIKDQEQTVVDLLERRLQEMPPRRRFSKLAGAWKCFNTRAWRADSRA
ncbi:hypothetical protein H0H81_003678 [Sphagnurus paluster]|uniref:Retrotransposon gag domain-containing protein n=1 Tax=Sphagnurus paluster TaxID=117069 RepID=A0A9P7FLR0_9AGAR|nr:hypothetical protein H0H81_003678 [Sphagnurus paluster]